jgi:hypothetical protein
MDKIYQKIDPLSYDIFLKQVSLETGTPLYKLQASLTTGKGSWERITPSKEIPEWDILKSQYNMYPTILREGAKRITEVINTPKVVTVNKKVTPSDWLNTNPENIGEFGRKPHKTKTDKRSISNKQLDRNMNNILFGGNSLGINSPVNVGSFGRKQKISNPLHNKSVYTQSNKQLDKQMNDMVFGNNVKWGTAPVLIGKFGDKPPLRNPNTKLVKKQTAQKPQKPTRMETLLDRKMDNILFGNELTKQSQKNKRIKRITE